MICPYIQAICVRQHRCISGCIYPNGPEPNPLKPPAKPTMKEIEGLVDDLTDADARRFAKARAALLEAVRQLAGENKC